MRNWLGLLAALPLCACGQDRAAPTPIRFLHTFGAEETEVFNATMAERGIAVESSLVPFARGQQVISEILRAGTEPEAAGTAWCREWLAEALQPQAGT